jgi:hypothetical protein
MEKCAVFEVRTEFLSIIYISFGFKEISYNFREYCKSSVFSDSVVISHAYFIII